MYRIVRFYHRLSRRRRTIRRGLTLRQAKAWCDNPETSSFTAQGHVARRRTRRLGCPWFDGFEKEA